MYVLMLTNGRWSLHPNWPAVVAAMEEQLGTDLAWFAGELPAIVYTNDADDWWEPAAVVIFNPHIQSVIVSTSENEHGSATSQHRHQA